MQAETHAPARAHAAAPTALEAAQDRGLTTAEAAARLALPLAFWLLLAVLVGTYLALVEFAKRRFEPRSTKPARA